MVSPPAARRLVRSYYPLAILLAVALAIRVALAPLWAYLPNNYTDEGFWKDWMLAIHQHGLLNIFRAIDDRLRRLSLRPLAAHASSTMLIGGGYGHDVFRLHLLVKAPPILFDLGLIVAVYVVSRSLFEELRLSTGRKRWPSPRRPIIAVPAAQSSTTPPSGRRPIPLLRWRCSWRSSSSPAAGRASASASGPSASSSSLIRLSSCPCSCTSPGDKTRSRFCRAQATVAGVWLVGLSPWLLHGDAALLLHVYRGLFAADYDRLSSGAWNAGCSSISRCTPSRTTR